MSAVQPTTDLQSLEREIATEAARVDIASYAARAPSSYPKPVYDISQVEFNQQGVARAVRYLDARQLLVRPLPECPQFVAFREVQS